MKEQSDLRTTNATPNSRMLWLIPVAVLTVSLIVGGGVYTWQRTILKSTEQYFQSKITSLESQINQLQQTDKNNKPQPPQDSPNATKENWLSYKSQKWAFEFQYPSDYVLDTSYENEYSDQGHIQLYEKSTYEAIQGEKIIEGASLIELSIYNNSEKLSALEWAKKDTAHSNFNGKHKTVQVNNRSAMSYSWAGLVEGDTILLTSDNKNYVYVFTVMYGGEESEIRKSFLRILETIKFQEATPSSSSGKRTLIVRNQVAKFTSQLPDTCEFAKIESLHFFSTEKTEWQQAVNPETDWVTYKNPEKGLEVSIPYNPNWGSPTYQLNPYDEYNNRLSFGTINIRGEGCGAWIPGTQRLDFIPAETKEKTLARLQKESDTLKFGYSIKSFTIDGKDVVEYNKDGLCGGGGTIIIGKKYNYELSTVCYANTREDIIKSMKFID